MGKMGAPLLKRKKVEREEDGKGGGVDECDVEILENRYLNM